MKTFGSITMWSRGRLNHRHPGDLPARRHSRTSGFLVMFFVILLPAVLLAQAASQPADSPSLPFVASGSNAEPGQSSGVPANLPKVPVSFSLNDSTVKDKYLSGVTVAVATTETGDFLVKGQTDASGKFLTELPPGKYFVTYFKSGYIPLPSSLTEIDPVKANDITVTLTMSMESVGTTPIRRIQVVLNWGSRSEQVKDIDSHLVCPCLGVGDHIQYSNKVHNPSGHWGDLDVDDTNWGGPETITLTDPPVGLYRYWIHNYTGPESHLGDAGVVVRVVLGDTMAGEFPIPADVSSRVWFPFKGIEVDQNLEPRIIRFTPAELANGKDRLPSPEQAMAALYP